MEVIVKYSILTIIAIIFIVFNCQIFYEVLILKRPISHSPCNEDYYLPYALYGLTKR